MGPFINGVILGLVLAMMVGPVFFMMINTSLKRGFNASAMLAIGVVLSDAVYAVITFYGSTLIFYLKQYDFVIGITGGSLIIIFGILIFTKKPTIDAEALEIEQSGTKNLINILKGFSMNLLNPSAFLFWLGVAGTITVKQHYSNFNAMLFYSGTLCTVFITDLSKGYLASKLKRLITQNFLIWMNRVCGTGLAVYGAYMIIRFML
jgi:threonine/homoserine/homoserine lactone efflux protein